MVVKSSATSNDNPIDDLPSRLTAGVLAFFAKSPGAYASPRLAVRRMLAVRGCPHTIPSGHWQPV